MSNTALYHESLSLTEALMNYRHQPIYRRLRRLGKRESTLHPDVLQRRGVGKRLLREAIARGPQLEVHSLVGLIFGHNQPSIAFSAPPALSAGASSPASPALTKRPET